MKQIDRSGVFIFKIVESGAGLTKKSGYPQWIARLAAMKKWVDQPSELEHFQMTEPGYVDWSSFNEDIIAFMVLFKDADSFTPESKLLNYEQIQVATGWDGTFESIPSLVGKEIQGRVEENTFDGKTSLQVNWVDAVDAPAERQLKVLPTDQLAELGRKLKMGPKATAKPAAAAAPASKVVTKPGKSASPTSAVAATPAASASATVAAPSVAAPATSAAPAGAEPVAKVAAPPKKAKTPPPPPAAVEESTEKGLPKECTRDEAWEHVCLNKGQNEDTVVQDAWIDATNEVGGDRDEDTFTPGDWAKVRNIVLKDIAA
jgi:hypothetical protein